MVLEKISDFSTNERNAFFIQMFFDHVPLFYGGLIEKVRTADGSDNDKPK